jgi:hypothetical protein
MDINEVIDWIFRRDDIVVAQPEKFVADLRERFQEPDNEGGFLAEVKAYNNRLREKYTKEGQGNCLLVVAGSNDKVSTVWGRSIADLASAYASIAANDDDYVTLMETVSKALMIHQLRKILGHDTD